MLNLTMDYNLRIQKVVMKKSFMKSIIEVFECPISKDGMYTKTTEEGLCDEETH